MQPDLILAYVILTTAIFGCMGNMLSLFIFTRPSMTSPVNVLLAGLSAIDMVLLLLVVPVFVLPSLPIWTDDGHKVFMAFMLKLVYPVNLTTQTCSVYVMVFITVERWTAVCHPLKVRVWCTVGKSRVALLVILLTAIAYNTVRFWEYSIVRINGTISFERNLRDFDSHPAYMRGYFTASYLITHFLIPFGLLLGLNSHVSLTILRMKRMRRQLTRQERGEQRTTQMLMIVTVVFAVCNFLPFIINFIESAKPDFFEDEDTKTIAYQMNDVGNLLVVINSATTGIIYCAFSQKYRDLFLRIITCRASRSLAAICGCPHFAAGKYLSPSTNLSRTNTSLRASHLSSRSRSSTAAVSLCRLHDELRRESTHSRCSRSPQSDHVTRVYAKTGEQHIGGSPNLLSVHASVSSHNGHPCVIKRASLSESVDEERTIPLLANFPADNALEETSFASKSTNDQITL